MSVPGTVPVTVPGTVPVTVLGGFLGAGKTTALNRLLREATCRTAVLVNDFGAIAVDAQLVQAQDGAVLSLSNGCVCCAIGPDLGSSLAQLLARQPAPERIVVEASGVSDPWRIAQLVRLQPGVALEAVPVLVDATAFATQLADPWLADTLARQLARADLVVLSKCDLADASQRAATRAAVLRLRPAASLVEAHGGALPPVLLPPPDLAPSRLAAEAPGHGFRSWHWPDPPVLDAARLRAVLDALPASVLRAKGVCHLGEAGAPHLLQLVGRRWTLLPWPTEGPGRGVPGLVLIGTQDMPEGTALATRFATARLDAGEGWGGSASGHAVPGPAERLDQRGDLPPWK